MSEGDITITVDASWSTPEHNLEVARVGVTRELEEEVKMAPFLLSLGGGRPVIWWGSGCSGSCLVEARRARRDFRIWA